MLAKFLRKILRQKQDNTRKNIKKKYLFNKKTKKMKEKIWIKKIINGKYRKIIRGTGGLEDKKTS